MACPITQGGHKQREWTNNNDEVTKSQIKFVGQMNAWMNADFNTIDRHVRA